MKVPRMEAKLNIFLFKIQFGSQLADLKKSLNIVNSACDEVRMSVKLRKIMKTFSYLGDTINQGTARCPEVFHVAMSFEFDRCTNVSPQDDFNALCLQGYCRQSTSSFRFPRGSC